MKIVTLPFKISAGEYLRIIFKMFIKRWWWAFFAIVSLFFALSVVNIAFIFIALMFVFIIIPMIMSFLYIYYGLLPQSRLSILEKSVEITNDKIILRFEHRDETIHLIDIKRYEVQSKWVVLHFNNRNYCFFVIPYTAFSCAEDLREAATILATVNKCC